MKKIIKIILLLTIVLVWLAPVSNQYNMMNDNMLRNLYIITLGVLLFVFFYENQYNRKRIMLSFAMLLMLFVCTVLTLWINKDVVDVSYGYLLNYFSFFVLINIKAKKLSEVKFIDTLFILICIVITAIGILTLLNNGFVEMILKTYYVVHYPHVYTVMWEHHKTVTFFATHSIACYVYYILWWLADYRMFVKKDLLSKFLVIGMIFNIVMCKSVSAVLCIGIIVLYYLMNWLNNNKNRRKAFLIIPILLIIIPLVVFKTSVLDILSSSTNGILGRFGSTGNLNASLIYAIKHVIPIGICNISGIWLTDGGYFFHFIRGGILLLALFYYGLNQFLNDNIPDSKRKKVLLIALLLFEVGYQFTIFLRFFLLIIFAVYYFLYLYNEQEGTISVNGKKTK